MDYYINGPDQIILTSNLTTTCPDGAVKFRSVENEDSHITPESIPTMLARTATLHPDQVALSYKENSSEKKFLNITYREYVNLVRTIAKAFIKLGLERYHSVCILGYNSPEWMISYLAAIHAGGFPNGIYLTNTPEACFYCLKSSRANIAVAADQTQVKKILKYAKDLPNLKKIVQYEGKPVFNDVLSWNDLLNIGKAESDISLNNVLKKIAINQCAAILHTSGTTGNPKAAMLSHDNFIFHTKRIVSATGMESNGSIISYLPLNHIVGQMFDIFLPILTAGTVYFADKDALKGGIFKNLPEVRPTFFFAIPRIWEKIVDRSKEISAETGLITPSALKQILGLDRCKLCVTGSAPLAVEVKTFLANMGIQLLEMYGLTECGPTTSNSPICFNFESIGKRIPGARIKIQGQDSDGEGEICVYGRNVFMGYLDDRQKTDEAIDREGWLHSGDIGKIDQEGFIYLTGRIKEIIKTAGGESIPPVFIEGNIKKELPCLGHAVLVGDTRKYLTVLLTLSCEVNSKTGDASEHLTSSARKWLKDLDCPFDTILDVIESGPDNKIMTAIQSGIDRANLKAQSNAQKVQKFALLSHDFCVVTGEVGPDMKLKRNVILSKYKHIIDELY